MKTNQFTLEQRSITEVISETITDFKITYSFNYENESVPKALSFNVQTLIDPIEKVITGSYLSGINQLDFKVIKSIDSLGTLVDHITASCNSIIQDVERFS